MLLMEARVARAISVGAILLGAACSGESEQSESATSTGVDQSTSAQTVPAGTAASALEGTEPERSATTTMVPGTQLPAPVALDELIPGLPSSDSAGVPRDWAILDLDPALVDDPDYAGDLDPFRGLIVCPVGAVRSTTDPWLARRFTMGETLLDNGVLSTELIVELTDAGGHDASMELMQSCTAADEGTTLEWSTSEVSDPATPDAIGVSLTELRIDGAPTQQTPFPYSIVATWLQRGDFEVAAVIGGSLPAGDWSAAAERLAADALLNLERDHS